MLFGVFVVISLLGAAGICFAADGFAGLDWLWLLPVGFIGSFLGLLILLFLLMLVMSFFVDIKKPQEKDNGLYRAAIHVLMGVGIPLLGIRFHAEGRQNIPATDRCLVVCNHLHELDPLFLMKVFPRKKLAFISKQEVSDFFLVGKFLHKIMGQPINRENDREALKTIINCIRLLKEDKNSVAVFPEGYIKPDRKLRHFRSGVFKIAQKANVPVVVCTIRNTHKILHNFLHFKRTHVHLHVLGVIEPEQWEGATTVDIAGKAYDMMAADLGPELVWQGE